MVRGVVDGCGLYDIVPAGCGERELWLEISPRSFNVRVREGLALTQLMVFMPWDKVRHTASCHPPPRIPAPAGLLIHLPMPARSLFLGEGDVR
jgi:hypothetical protein